MKGGEEEGDEEEDDDDDHHAAGAAPTDMLWRQGSSNGQELFQRLKRSATMRAESVRNLMAGIGGMTSNEEETVSYIYSYS